jgi:hypothetical protein
MALNVLKTFVPQFFTEVPLSVWSAELDLVTFCHVLQLMKPAMDHVVELLNEFLGNNVPNEEECQLLETVIGDYSGGVIPLWRR